MELLRQTQGLNCLDGDKFVFKCVYRERVFRFPGRLRCLLHSFYLRHEWASFGSDFWTFSYHQLPRTPDFCFFVVSSMKKPRRYHRTRHKSTWVCFSGVLTLSWNSKLLFLHGVMHNLFPKYDNWYLVNSKTSWCSANWEDAITDLFAFLLKSQSANKFLYLGCNYL